MSLLPRVRRTLVLLVVVALAIPVAAGAQDLDQVERQVDQLDQQVQAANAEYEATWAEVESTQAQLEGLKDQAAQLEQQAAEVDAMLAERARTMFKFGGDPVLASLLSADGAQGAIERASLMAALTGRDRATLESAVNVRQQLDQTEALVADKAAELDGLLAKLDDQRSSLMDRLEAASALAADLRARAARQRRIDRGVQQGIYACIHDYNTFSDTWGAPRSGGRRHKGVDVMAPYDVPVYAFTNGVISRMNHGHLGGTQLYLWGDDGNEYFYAHLSSYADTSYVGKRVEAGELIAYNGDTGNARGTPHVHFEVHPGGGRPVDPYPWMAAACK